VARPPSRSRSTKAPSNPTLTRNNQYDDGEVPLNGVRAEFREALRQEIEAARRNATSAAVPLINGRRIAQVGSGFQYIFDIESALTAPGDAPGDLIIAGQSPLEVTIVSVDGLAVILSVPRDLGEFVPTARLQSNLTQLMRKLIVRIENLGDDPNPAGERIRGAGPVTGRPVSVNVLGLNVGQTAALESVLGRDTTFIWGPPGTGKTRTIGAIGRELYARNRSMLMVSHTNTAVDQALLKIAEQFGDGHEAIRAGKVLRVGDPVDPQLLAMDDLLLGTHVARRSAELAARREELVAEHENRVGEALGFGSRIAIAEWVADAASDISTMTTEMGEIHGAESDLASARSDLDALRMDETQWEWAARAAHQAFAATKHLEVTNASIADRRLVVTDLTKGHEELGEPLRSAEATLHEVTHMGGLSRRWRRLPSPDEQRIIVEELRARGHVAEIEMNEAVRLLSEAETQAAELERELDRFTSQYGNQPTEVIAQAEKHTSKIEECLTGVERLNRHAEDRRVALVDLLTARLAVLREWELTDAGLSTLETMLESVVAAHRRATTQATNDDPPALRREQSSVNTRIVAIETEIAGIDEQLKKVEQLVIADAAIVATTLTRTYLRDSIFARRFDTVVLDEASMAPIPALWVAASLASANVVAVGDYKQLPPIVMSSSPEAQKWLGQDIFEAAGIRDYRTAPDHFVKLTEQFRMHPAISAISNELIYDGLLSDGPGTEDGAGVPDWYRSEWGHDTPVLLVDMASTNAWVTSVSRGERASRLNFLSATVSVDLAEQLLRIDRDVLPPGRAARILIVSPYRPHSKLVELLVRESHLAGEVRAGTTHSFQGSEADVVIVDLVNDEPHWRVNLFTPALDEATRRLFNVALTRARRRLIILGDLDYNARFAKKAFLGRELLPFLRRYPVVDALDVVPAGLAARAAVAQTSILGGEVEPESDRVVATQRHFFSMFAGDLTRARRRVVIYSPFITENRVAQLEPPLKAAIGRGIQIFVVTKAVGDRPSRDAQNYRRLEWTLADWGLVVVHKRNMHEKLVFIDDEVLWSGSLNPLSFSDTQEVMERRRSRQVVDNYVETLRLNDLVGEYREGLPSCPICGSEVVASEGANEPFYWRCVEDDCYSRSIDGPRFTGGMVTCSNCAAPVAFGEWGEEYKWRCTDNARHRQNIARTHLRLSGMRALVPPRILRQLDRQFGLLETRARQTLEAPDQGQLSL